jgi:hypothetical protein
MGMQAGLREEVGQRQHPHPGAGALQEVTAVGDWLKAAAV